MKKIIVNTDGGARGNPGPAGIGVVFSDSEEKVISTYHKYIGEATNNVAEYKALVWALELAKNYEFDKIECRLDSELVVKQLNGEYKVKDQVLKELYSKVKELTFFKPISFFHVRREKNKLADKLVNQAIDETNL